MMIWHNLIPWYCFVWGRQRPRKTCNDQSCLWTEACITWSCGHRCSCWKLEMTYCILATMRSCDTWLSNPAMSCWSTSSSSSTEVCLKICCAAVKLIVLKQHVKNRLGNFQQHHWESCAKFEDPRAAVINDRSCLSESPSWFWEHTSSG